jgi:cell division protein ZapA
MAQVAIAINGRRYEVNCDDGEEDRLRQLAEAVDRRVRTLGAAVGEVGEVRLLLLTCLLMQDELMEGAGGEGTTAAGRISSAAGPGVGNEIDHLAERIEAVAAQLKRP